MEAREKNTMEETMPASEEINRINSDCLFFKFLRNLFHTILILGLVVFGFWLLQ